MEQFFVQHPAVGYILVLGLLSIIAWLIKMAIASQLKRMDSHSKRMDEIEFNYKDEFKKVRADSQEEFKKVRQDNNDKHLEILGVLSEVRIEIAELKGINHNNK